MLEKEQQYNSYQEAVEKQREVINLLRQKYHQAESELKDIKREDETDKLELNDRIREYEKELDFHKAINQMMLKDGEITKLMMRMQYDFD